MDSEPSTSSSPVTPAHSPDEIQDEIETTRADLGDTVEALAAKADVKAQVRNRVEETRDSVNEKKDEILGKAREISPEGALHAATGASHKARENPVPVAAIAAFAGGFLLGRLTASADD